MNDTADCGHPLPDYPVSSEATDKVYCSRHCRWWLEDDNTHEDTHPA